MSNVPSDGLKEVVAENIIDYIQGQTKGGEVSSAQMKVLENGVSNICIAGYPEEEKDIHNCSPKVVRAALDTSQLSLGNQLLKIVDPINPPENEIIAGVLSSVVKIKEGVAPPTEVKVGQLRTRGIDHENNNSTGRGL